MRWSMSPAARGYKGGGINLGFTGESIKPLFRPEEATSFEAGIKARLFENSLVAGVDGLPHATSRTIRR